MDNPFSFSGIVDDPSFCNRKAELSELKRLIQSSQNVLLYSHRRYGKTSLILKSLKSLRDVTPVYVDLYGTTGVEDFISALLKGISAAEPKVNRLMRLVRQTIRGFTVNINFDPATGLPCATPVFQRQFDSPPLQEVFQLAEEISHKRKIVIAFDEFQEIAKYGKDTFEKQLRSCIQRHRQIAYIFAGSQKHLIVEMFSNAKRAFYRQATALPLPKIKTTDYVKWIQGLYRKNRRQIDPEAITQVVTLCDNHPMYLQEFFFYLWDEKSCTADIIDQIEQRIIQKRLAEYAYAWDSFTLNQRKALKLVTGSHGSGLYAADNLAKFGFRTASQVKTALNKLIEREFMIKNGEYQIQDPMFKRWLKTVS